MKRVFQLVMPAIAVAVTSVAIAAHPSFAQTAPTSTSVPFQGLVGSACTFSNIANGALSYDNAQKLSASLIPGTYSGTPGSVDLNCSGDVELSASAPQDNGSTANILPNATVARGAVGYITDPLAYTDLAQGGNSITSGRINGPVNETYAVGMIVQSNIPIPEGVYDYNVVVTATPL